MDVKESVLIPKAEYDRLYSKLPKQSESGISSEDILASLPKRHHSAAQRLLRFMNCEDILWNNRGELLVNGCTVEGSHIVDLVRDSVYHMRCPPPGYEQFYQCLAEHNPPETLIQDTTRRPLLRVSKPPSKWINL